MIGMSVRAGDIPLDANKMKLVTEAERVIAHVVALRVEEESRRKRLRRKWQRQPNRKSSRRVRRKWKAKKGPRREAGEEK